MAAPNQLSPFQISIPPFIRKYADGLHLRAKQELQEPTISDPSLQVASWLTVARMTAITGNVSDSRQALFRAAQMMRHPQTADYNDEDARWTTEVPTEQVLADAIFFLGKMLLETSGDNDIAVVRHALRTLLLARDVMQAINPSEDAVYEVNFKIGLAHEKLTSIYALDDSIAGVRNATKHAMFSAAYFYALEQADLFVQGLNKSTAGLLRLQEAQGKARQSLDAVRTLNQLSIVTSMLEPDEDVPNEFFRQESRDRLYALMAEYGLFDTQLKTVAQEWRGGVSPSWNAIVMAVLCQMIDINPIPTLIYAMDQVDFILRKVKTMNRHSQLARRVTEFLYLANDAHTVAQRQIMVYPSDYRVSVREIRRLVVSRPVDAMRLVRMISFRLNVMPTDVEIALLRPDGGFLDIKLQQLVTREQYRQLRAELPAVRLPELHMRFKETWEHARR